MPLGFERVSFSYTSPTRANRWTRKRNQNPDAAETPRWGTEATEFWALQGVDFQIEDGEFFGIAGHTGSGKSTLIRHMNGLLQPTSGRVLLNGCDLADKKHSAAAKGQVGIVFQHPEQQLFASTVADDVCFGPRNLGLDREEAETRMRWALEQMGLPTSQDFLESSPFELSGGQQRRVAIAGILAMKPQILVLDEPAAGLDPASRRELLELLKNLNESGTTIAMVSHNMDDLARYCHRILVLNHGRTALLGTPAEVFRNAEPLRSMGLDVPEAYRFAQELKDAGFPLCENADETAGEPADEVEDAPSAAPLFDPATLAQRIAASLQAATEGGSHGA